MTGLTLSAHPREAFARTSSACGFRPPSATEAAPGKRRTRPFGHHPGPAVLIEEELGVNTHGLGRQPGLA